MKNMKLLNRIRRLGCLAAVGIAALTWTSFAQADITITVTDSNSIFGTVQSFTHTYTGTPTFSASYSPGTFGNFTGFTLSIGATAAGPFNGAELTDVQITGTDNAFIGHDTITVSASGGTFTSPGSSPLLVSSTLTSSNLSGSGFLVSAASATFSSSLTSGAFSNPSTALLSVTGNGQSSQTGTTTGGDSAPTVLASSTGSFQLTNTLTATFSSGQTGTLDATTQATAVATATPEPSTMAIAGLGALGMIGYGLRRRKALGA
jgi:hypothetical protein